MLAAASFGTRSNDTLWAQGKCAERCAWCGPCLLVLVPSCPGHTQASSCSAVRCCWRRWHSVLAPGAQLGFVVHVCVLLCFKGSAAWGRCWREWHPLIVPLRCYTARFWVGVRPAAGFFGGSCWHGVVATRETCYFVCVTVSYLWLLLLLVCLNISISWQILRQTVWLIVMGSPCMCAFQ